MKSKEQFFLIFDIVYYIFYFLKIIFRHDSHSIVKAALRAVGNIVTGDDVQTQVILNSGALPHILHLLSSEKESIRKEASWTISNITAGNRQQIQAVIDSQIFPVLIHILKNDEFKTRKEAAWSITNATSSGTAEQIKYLVRKMKQTHIKSTTFCTANTHTYREIHSDKEPNSNIELGYHCNRLTPAVYHQCANC